MQKVSHRPWLRFNVYRGRNRERRTHSPLRDMRNATPHHHQHRKLCWWEPTATFPTCAKPVNMKPPEFLRKDFELYANVWCHHEGRINRHKLVLVKHDENHISYWKTCLSCQHEYETLRRLGVDKKHPIVADRMPTTEWVFLCLHSEDVIK